MRLTDFIRLRNPGLGQGQLDGIQRRLVFAGLSEELNATEQDFAAGLMLKVQERMAQTELSLQNHVELMSTAPRAGEIQAGPGEVVVSLLNERKVRFNPANNVVTPFKVQTA